MKNLKWVIGVILIPIIVVFLNSLLNKKSPNVRYTLSGGIPVSFLQDKQLSKGEDVSVQELVVKNIGNAESKKVQIRIGKPVIKYGITKNFSGDNPQVFSKNNRFELLYPELPPDGEFRLVFYTLGSGVTEKNLVVKDQNGLCKPALYKGKNIMNIILLSLFVIYFIGAIFFLLISFFKDRWQRLQYKSYYEIISKKKPFYLSRESWDEIVENAIEKNLSNDYYSSTIEGSLCYKILSSDRPELLSKHVWMSILGKCNDRLEDKFVKKMEYLYEDNILKLLDIVKPKHFSQDKWDKIQEYLNKMYINYKKSYTSYTLENIAKEIKKDKPSVIRMKYWQEYIRYLKEKYKEIVIRDLVYQENALDYLEKNKINEILGDEKEIIEGIKNKAYAFMLHRIFSKLNNVSFAKGFLEGEKPSWMEDSDYIKVRDNCEQLIRHYKFTQLFDLLNMIFSNQILPVEKPNYLTDREWSIILEIERRLKINT